MPKSIGTKVMVNRVTDEQACDELTRYIAQIDSDCEHKTDFLNYMFRDFSCLSFRSHAINSAFRIVKRGIKNSNLLAIFPGPLKMVMSLGLVGK